MVNSCDVIDSNLRRFKDIYPRELKPFWEPANFPEEPFFNNVRTEDESSPKRELLIISGPSRNGNHLIHSLLDNHPNLPRIAGEDSIINALFPLLSQKTNRIMSVLRSDECVDFLKTLSGKGRLDKWKSLYEESRKAEEFNTKTETWSGVYYGRGEKNFVYDYRFF